MIQIEIILISRTLPNPVIRWRAISQFDMSLVISTSCGLHSFQLSVSMFFSKAERLHDCEIIIMPLIRHGYQVLDNVLWHILDRCCG
jgi:hypothetical protein